MATETTFDVCALYNVINVYGLINVSRNRIIDYIEQNCIKPESKDLNSKRFKSFSAPNLSFQSKDGLPIQIQCFQLFLLTSVA